MSMERGHHIDSSNHDSDTEAQKVSLIAHHCDNSLVSSDRESTLPLIRDGKEIRPSPLHRQRSKTAILAGVLLLLIPSLISAYFLLRVDTSIHSWNVFGKGPARPFIEHTEQVTTTTSNPLPIASSQAITNTTNPLLIASSTPARPSEPFEIPLNAWEHVSRSPILIEHHWTITSDLRRPDGVKKRVYLINGKSPGPTIEARSGDTLRIHVTNNLENQDDGLSIHWHGLRMRGANEMDGAVGFTQCPILVGGNFTYEFQIDEDQHGTFWYHAHSRLLRGDGLYGGLVVHRPVVSSFTSEADDYGYAKDILLMVGDWYHASAEEVLGWHLSPDAFGNNAAPDSMTVNGIGKFNCSRAVPARPLDCISVEAPHLDISDSAPIRVRLVNTGYLTGFSFHVRGAKIIVIQVDGGTEIRSEETDSVGVIYPGERADLIMQWIDDSDFSGARVQISLDGENLSYDNYALEPIQSFPVVTSQGDRTGTPQGSPPSGLSTFNLQTAKASSQPELPSTANKTIVLYSTVMMLSEYDNHPYGFINYTTWRPQSNPQQPLLSLPRSTWDKYQFVPFTGPISSSPFWVDIVINNLDEKGHPFHLHGHEFYVLATYGAKRLWGSYNPFVAGIPPGGEYNLENPVRKDTVYIPRRGYAVLRFKADNEGIWMFHCHVLWHQASGMAMAFQVGGDENGVFVGDEERKEKARAMCPKA